MQPNKIVAGYKDISMFEGLGALRFLAAFLVVMHHSEVIKKKNGIFSLEWLGLFRNGGNAVVFFFVLSGFLITYLLLKEDHKTRTINIANFYLKRVLRIWPLYFLLIIIGTIGLPIAFQVLGIHYEMPYALSQVWYYFVLFVPGLVTYFYGHHFLEFLWSIGVEEVFYLVWPLLFKFLRRNLLIVLLSTIAIKAVLMAIAYFFTASGSQFNYLVYMFNFESIAIGGLGAYFIFNRERSLTGLFLYRKAPQIVIYTLLVVFLVASPNIHNAAWHVLFRTPVVSPLFIDFLYLYLIIGVSVIDTNIIRLRSKRLSYLGGISYGIYMYHMLVVFAIIQLFKKQLSAMDPLTGNVVYYSILGLSVILLSAISKTSFEDYFLRLKPKRWNNDALRQSVPARKRWQPKIIKPLPNPMPGSNGTVG